MMSAGKKVLSSSLINFPLNRKIFFNIEARVKFSYLGFRILVDKHFLHRSVWVSEQNEEHSPL
jgi:hypothetical protein